MQVALTAMIVLVERLLLAVVFVTLGGSDKVVLLKVEGGSVVC